MWPSARINVNCPDDRNARIIIEIEKLRIFLIRISRYIIPIRKAREFFTWIIIDDTALRKEKKNL